MSESKIKGFAKGIAKATGRIAGATLRGTGTAIGGVAKGIGIVLGALTNEAEKLANQPKGTAKKLHDVAQSVVKNMKESKLAANAGKLKTAFHAGKLALGGIVTVMTEAIALVDNIIADNAILNALEKKFAEFKGDTSKFKKWLKEHDRLGAYAVYYGVITMVFAVLWEAGLADQFGKGDETLTKKSQKIIKDLEKEVKDSEIGKKIIGPWMEDKKEETKPANTDKKPTVQKEPNPDKTDNSNIIVVNKGDTLFDLAKKHGTTVEELAKANNLKKPYKINIGQKLKKPDIVKTQTKTKNETKITVDASTIIHNNIIDFDAIRKSPELEYKYYKTIVQNPQFFYILQGILADVEGVEPETYYLGDGYGTQGIGMTHNYAVLPGQEVEDWMVDTETRTKRKDMFAPIVNFMGNVRSYNDLWQQVGVFLLDKGKNPYSTFRYILKKTAIHSMSFNQLAAIIAASFQDRTMSKQILDRLIDKASPTGLTTNSGKIDHAFSTKRSAGQKRRNNIEKEAYNGRVGTIEFTVGKDHSIKKQKFKNSTEFLNTNKKGGGADFNKTFDRNIVTNERAALFKMFYHIIHPDNNHFNITKDDIELITALKGHFGNQWKKYFETKKATNKGLKLADYKIQEKVVFYILDNPQYVAQNPKKVHQMLKKWYAENDYQSQQEQDQILLAHAKMMQGLGF